jgi:outer membrane lipoprotein SlyB
MSRSSRSARNTAIRVVVSAGLIVAGANACTNGGNIFSSGVDPNDSCGAEHAAFADSKSFYLQEVAQGALFGAFSGAALGALTAATTGGDAGQGALIGAGAGTVAGGVAGYFHARQQQSADEASLANSV